MTTHFLAIEWWIIDS